MTAHVILYTTAGCHLCEQAGALLEQYAAYARIEMRELDILDTHPDNTELHAAIPFLEHPASGARLFWPFDAAQLHRWIQHEAYT
ncbi:MAG: glutaredoxin family protein [Halorhodospira sp.]